MQFAILWVSMLGWPQLVVLLVSRIGSLMCLGSAARSDRDWLA